MPVGSKRVGWELSAEAFVEVIDSVEDKQKSVVNGWQILDFLFQAHPANFDGKYNEYHFQMMFNHPNLNKQVDLKFIYSDSILQAGLISIPLSVKAIINIPPIKI